MSTGGLVGGIVGGVVGFFIGGPMGAVYGAGLGLGLGMMVDPMTPDAPTIGAPVPDTTVMSSEVGVPCPEVSGTGKIVGHLICYGAERTEAVYATPESSGGKGGPPEPEPQITGYKYYMSWVLGFCAGEVDTLYSIYKNDNDKLWSGTLDKPATGGKETIVVKGLGSVEFYFGTADQLANTKVGELLDDDTLNTPYRNYCWALFDDCYIGSYPRTPTISIVIKKIPADSFSSLDTIQTYDSNPSHALYFVLNKLAGLPASWLDEADFAAMAQILRLEYRGISCVFKDQQSAMSYIQSMLNHIDCVLRYGSDGKFHPKLIRDDYTISALPVIDEDYILDDPSFVRASWIDTLNEVKVQYSKIINVTRIKQYEGSLFWFGVNGYYKNIHDGNTLDKHPDARLIPDIEDWDIINASSSLYGMAVQKADGLWYTRGPNDHGQTGQGFDSFAWTGWGQPTVGKDIPYFWSMINPLTAKSAGISSAGGLYLCGYNGSDALNIDGGSPITVFTRERSGGIFYLTAGTFGSGTSGGMIASGATSFENTRTTPLISSNLVGYGTAGSYAFGYGLFTNSIKGQWAGIHNGNFSNVVGLWGGNNMLYFGIGVSDDFAVYGAGTNSDGRLGVGAFSSYEELSGLVLGGNWKSFDCGVAHCLGVKTDGTLWSCGQSSDGQVGQGDYVSQHTMVQIGSATNWVKCLAGPSTSYALDSNGEVWACGKNSSYQCGYGGSGIAFKREQTNGTWYQIYVHGGGLLLLK